MNDRPQGSQAPSGERATLSRDLADFLIEFSIGLNKYGMYPGDHPSLGPASQGVTNRLRTLLTERATLSLGVARNQLVIEGVATDPKNPVLSDLASRLHRHHLGAIRFQRGVTVDEVQSVLKLLAVDAERAEQPLGLGPPEQLEAWTHIRLYSVTYDRLQLLEEDETPEETAEQRERRTRGAQLWLGLAQAALAAEETDEALPTDPGLVAKAIDAHHGGTAYDQVIVGYLLQIAEELRSVGGREEAELRRRMSHLISALEPRTLQRLLEMGGNREQRREFLLDASQGLALEAVIDLIRVAAEGPEQQTVSHSMLRMLQKLARHGDGDSGRRRAEAEAAVREQVGELIENWSLPDPNPETYGEALHRMTRARPVFAVSPEQRFRPEPRRIIEMALEVDTMGEVVGRAVDDLVNQGELKWVLEALIGAAAPTVTEGIWRRLATPEGVAAVAGAEPLDLEVLDLLLPRVGIAAARPLMDALAEAQQVEARRALVDRLIRFGSAIAPLALAHLNDERWYVQRNMLTILSALPELPPEFDPAPFLQHPEAPVRLEALRLMLHIPTSRERAVCRALADRDERAVRLGLSAAIEDCPNAAVPLVVSRATSGENPELQTVAVRVLGKSKHPMALNALLAIAQPTRRLFRTKLPPKTPVYLAALLALQHHAQEPRARTILERAARAKDADIARAARGDSDRGR